MTTIYTTRVLHMPSVPVRPELTLAFATAEERDALLAAARADGWRVESKGELTVTTVADAVEALAAKVAGYASTVVDIA